jgi:hypothetical protein
VQGAEWTHTDQDRFQYRALANVVKNLQIPQQFQQNFLTNQATVSFSRFALNDGGGSRIYEEFSQPTISWS